MSTFGDKAPEQASILGGGSIVGCAASCFLRLRIRGEVVGEQQAKLEVKPRQGEKRDVLAELDALKEAVRLFIHYSL